MSDEPRLMTRDDVIAAYAAGQSLSRAVLRGLDLTGEDWGEADFSRADLTGADFTDCDIDEANFTGAILINAMFLGVESDASAKFTDAIGYAEGGWDSRDFHFFGIWFDGTHVWHGRQGWRGWMIKAGCRWFTLPHAREHWGPEGEGGGDREDAAEIRAECLELVEKIAATPEPKL